MQVANLDYLLKYTAYLLLLFPTYDITDTLQPIMGGDDKVLILSMWTEVLNKVFRRPKLQGSGIKISGNLMNQQATKISVVIWIKCGRNKP